MHVEQQQKHDGRRNVPLGAKDEGRANAARTRDRSDARRGAGASGHDKDGRTSKRRWDADLARFIV